VQSLQNQKKEIINDCESKINKIKQKLNLLKWFTWLKKHTHTRLLRNVVTAVFIPTLTYALECFPKITKTWIQKMNSPVNQMANIILGTPKNTATGLSLKELNIPPIATQIDKLELTLLENKHFSLLRLVEWLPKNRTTDWSYIYYPIKKTTVKYEALRPELNLVATRKKRNKYQACWSFSDNPRGAMIRTRLRLGTYLTKKMKLKIENNDTDERCPLCNEEDDIKHYIESHCEEELKSLRRILEDKFKENPIPKLNQNTQHDELMVRLVFGDFSEIVDYAQMEKNRTFGLLNTLSYQTEVTLINIHNKYTKHLY